jgi:hypothetical protein
LWPAQTPEQLRQLQAEADAGAASWALDPEMVATRFGVEVMGWPDASASVIPDFVCVDPSMAGNVTSSPTNVVYPICSDSEIGGASYPGYLSDPWLQSPAMSSGSQVPGNDPAFVSYALRPCAPAPGACDVPGEQQETLRLYQPLEQGEGNIWGVLEARTDSIHLSLAAGQNVRSGATVAATFWGPWDPHAATPTLGHASCGAAGASSATEDVIPGERISDEVDLPGSAACEGTQAGYVWAASAPSSLARADSSVELDPIADGERLQDGLLGLTAAPVVMTFPEAPNPTSASPTLDEPSPSRSVADTRWTSYTDPMGWTIDVPSEWLTEPFHDSGGTTFDGAHFASGDVTHQSAPDPISDVLPDTGEVMLFVWHEETGTAETPTDDSTLPLSFDPAKGYTIDFGADGLSFSILVKPGEGDVDISGEHEAILERMIGSISFEPWTVGEKRHGWTSFGVIDPEVSQWVTLGPNHFFTLNEQERRVFGPVPDCPAGEASYEIRDTGMAAMICSDGTTSEWDLKTGHHNQGTRPSAR